MKSLKKVIVVLVVGLLLPTASLAASKSSQRKTSPPRAHARALSSAERKQAQLRLAEMGYGSGSTSLIAFQKFEGRKVTGALSRGEFDAIMAATAPAPKDSGYRHVEVDLDRQILVLVGDDGNIQKILPSLPEATEVQGKANEWLGVHSAWTFSDLREDRGVEKVATRLALLPELFQRRTRDSRKSIVPDTPQSHGCIGYPMSAAVAISRQLPVGTILLIYDQQSFVSGKAWAEKIVKKLKTASRSEGLPNLKIINLTILYTVQELQLGVRPHVCNCLFGCLIEGGD
jgi:hypothetical protein